MSDLQKQWAVVQKRPRPLSPAVARRIHEACLEVGITSYEGDVIEAAVVAATPRPMRVYRRSDGQWGAFCRICGVVIEKHMPTHAKALESALWELHDAHGCPNRKTTGEPCDPQCIHCHGWQWCANEHDNTKEEW